MSKWILSWQSKFNKFLQAYLHARSNVPHFSTKKKYVIILKMTEICTKNLAIFRDDAKIEIYFPYNTFLKNFLTTKFFFNNI